MTQTKADDLFEAIRLFIAAEIRRAMDAADLAGMVKALAPTVKAEVLAELPTPKDGKDADPEAIKAAVETAVAALPKPEKGEDGKDADAAAIAHEVLERVKQGLPVLKDGADGANGKDGADGRDGKDGEPGKSITAEDVRPILEAEISKSILEIERRSQDTVQAAVQRMPTPKDGANGIDGKDGAPGRDGKDGLSLETFDFQAIDGGRILRFEAKGGDVLVAREVQTAVLLDAGVFEAGKVYKAGDCPTYGGSLFVATRTTLPTEKPADGSGAFRLAVKRGQNGKDAA